MSTGILVVSVLVQFTAAGLALRLVRATGHRLAWGSIAIALILMGIRRSITLFRVMSEGSPLSADPSAEIVALIISFLMLLGVLLIGRLFDDAQQNEDRLAESEHRFRDFAEVSADWFWEQDENFRFTYISATNPDVTGLIAEDHYGKTRRETAIRGVSEDDLAAHERLLEQRKPFEDFRFHRLNKEGGIIHISIRGKPVFDTIGKFQGYRGTGQEITPLVEAEKTIRAERDKAEMANRAKSAFLANMSHEFRTPLNGIIGYLELLSSDASASFGEEKRKNIIKDLHRASKHLLSLISDVLDLTQIEAGTETARPETFELGAAITDCIDVVRPVGEDKSIEILFESGSKLPSLTVDKTHFNQILINLLSNAINYSKPGARINIDAETEPDGSIVVRVHDTGIGISAEDMQRVFEEFERGGGVMQRGQGGTGLGLPLAKRLIELNGGAISLKSEPGKGSIAEMRFKV